MAILFPSGFTVTTKEPIDSRLVLTKAEMAAMLKGRMPASYFALCSDDGKLYLYSEANEKLADIGRFRLYEPEVTSEAIAEHLPEALNTVLADNSVFESVKYEILNYPQGTLINYTEEEIRVMCPADTDWSQQAENIIENSYCILLKAYAPNDGVVSFKYDLAATVTSDTIHYFENNEFAGIDELGRKYSLVLLPVAEYNGSEWVYHGALSTESSYTGWYYSVEWYNEAGEIVASDCIRINLSNEACHNNILPYYMNAYLTGAKLNGTPLESTNGIINLEVPEYTSSEDVNKITILEDGTLEVSALDVDKLFQDEDDYLLLECEI